MSTHTKMVHDLILHKLEKGELNNESKTSLKNVLDENEIRINVIQQQLKDCKMDHAELQSQIKRLVLQNKELVQQLKAFIGDNTERKSDYLGASDAIEDIQQQLDLALEEKNTLQELWKTSLKEIESLKEELLDYKSGKQLILTQSKLNDAQKDYTEVIKILECRVSDLKAENDHLIAKTQLLENQLRSVTLQMTSLNEKNLSLSNSLKEATDHVQDWKSRFLSLEAKYIDLDRTYQADKVKFAYTYEFEKVESQLKAKLEETLRQRDELQTALEKCHERIAELLRNAAIDRKRVEEAVSLVDGALQSRDQALANQSASVDDLRRLKDKMNSIVEEAGLKIAKETAAIREQFIEQQNNLMDQLKCAQQENSRKTAELKQLNEECVRLQSTLNQKSPVEAGPEKLNVQLERELYLVEVECSQLRAENEALQLSLDKLQQRYRRSNRLKLKLKQELQNIEQQNQLCQHELSVTNQRAELMHSQLQQTSLELAQLHSDTLLQKESVNSIQARISAANSVELCKQLDDCYVQMNEKWKHEMSDLTEKFEVKLKKMKRKSKCSERTTHKSDH